MAQFNKKMKLENATRRGLLDSTESLLDAMSKNIKNKNKNG